MKRKTLAKALAGSLGALWIATPALATTVYTDVVTPTFSYTNIQETSTWGDPEPLFDQPVQSGDGLDFNPSTFLASAVGAGGSDQTGSHLQMSVSVNDPLNDTIDAILVSESGFVDLQDTNLVGTAGTGTFVGMTLFVTVLSTVSGNNIGQVLNVVGTFSPTSLTGLPGDLGITNWTGAASIDVAASFSDVTSVQISVNNDVIAASEFDTSAYIEKTDFMFKAVPEPSIATLLGALLLLIGLARMSRTPSSSASRAA